MSTPRLDIIRHILDNSSEDMPNQRFQDPVIQRRTDVPRPYYFIRPYVPLFTADGLQRRQQRMMLGYCDEMNMRQAKARKEQVMATVNAGKFVIQSQVAFAELVERYLELHVPTLGKPTQADYRNKIKNHIKPAFKDALLCDITRDVVQRWINSKTKLAWWSRKGLLTILSSIFTQAEHLGLWDGRNPCEGVSAGRKLEKHVKRIPRADDLNSFLAALPDTNVCSAAAARCMVLTAVATGLRISEILGLQRCDVDAQSLSVQRAWRRGSVVPVKSTASRRTRQVGALGEYLKTFANGKRPEAFLFARSNGLPPDDRDLQQHVFRPAATAAGIYHPGFGMHEFRRLNITWRQEAGATVYEAQKAAGHSQPSTTWVYTITDDAERERGHVDTILSRLGISPSEPIKPAVSPQQIGQLATTLLQ